MFVCARVQWHFLHYDNAAGCCSSLCRCVHLSEDYIYTHITTDLDLRHHGTCAYVHINTQGEICAVSRASYSDCANSKWPLASLAHLLFPSCLYSIPSLLSRSHHLSLFPQQLQICLPRVYVSIFILPDLTCPCLSHSLPGIPIQGGHKLWPGGEKVLWNCTQLIRWPLLCCKCAQH